MSFIGDFFRRLFRALVQAGGSSPRYYRPPVVHHHQTQVDERSLFGALGERQVLQIVADFVERNGGTYLWGPILFPLYRDGPLGEKDFLVYTQGTIFCIEVKNYLGTVSYDERGDICVDRWSDYSKMKYLPNPLKSTIRFIRDLKKQVKLIEPRFGGLWIIPVVAFVHNAETDITPIYSFEQGIIYAEQLPQFFLFKANTRRPSSWITGLINSVIPSWDWVTTAQNEMVGGILTQRQLTFKDLHRGTLKLLFSRVHQIHWRRGPSFAYDEMTVIFTDGATRLFYCVDGEIALQRMDELHPFPIRNLQALYIGVSNKLHYFG
jgi:Nuclease-related domain